MVATSVNNWPTNAFLERRAIAKIHKHKGLHEGHHFILMAMEVHSAHGCDMHHFIRELFILLMIDDQKVIYPSFFAFSFSSNVLIFFFNVF
jgi:hypothetical protein